jgi:multiple sugar transport system permease protein
MNKVLKQIIGWFIAAVFFFPIYFWITVSVKKDKDIFALPPKLFDFELSFKPMKKYLVYHGSCM